MTSLNWFRIAAAWMAALLLVSVSAGCGKQEPAPQNGSAELRVTLPQALSAADVRRVRVEVRGPGLPLPMAADLVQVGTAWQGTVSNIPAGNDRIVDAYAYDMSGMVIFQGSSAPMTISAGSTASAFLMLQQVNTPPPFHNEAPQISSIVLSANTVSPGGSIYLMALAYDANGDALSYSWTAAAGSFSAPNHEMTYWTAPSTEGTHRLRLEVTDSKGTSASVNFDVYVQQDGASGSVDVSVGFNSWPEVRVMQGAPSVLAAGTTTQLSATVVDADGDALAHAWFSDCMGWFNDMTSATPSFTLDWVPSSGRCTFQVSVTDGKGGAHSGTLVLQAGTMPRANVQPKIDSTWQTASQANGGELVTLGLTAHDPDGMYVSFYWYASAGYIQSTSWGSNSSQAEWVAPVCFTDVLYITAVVTDWDGASQYYSFTVNPAPGANCGAQTVTGIRNIHNIQADGSPIVTPADLSFSAIGAYVPTADNSGFVYVAGSGRPDGTFVIPGVERTPYYLRFGSTYIWTSSRFVDLSGASLGRPYVDQEPTGTQLAFQLDGLSPWQPTDDLQMFSSGAGIGYFTTSCAAPFFPSPADGATALSGSIDYVTSMRNCGINPAPRLDPSQGDFLQLTQNVSRYDSTALPTGLTMIEVRKGLQVYNLSGSTDGGTVDGGPMDAGNAGPGTLLVRGTMQPLPTTMQQFDFRAAEFEALALEAHSSAIMADETVNMGTLPGYYEYGQYDGYPDLANVINDNPGQGNFPVRFQYGNPYPGFWPKIVTAQATSAAPFSVSLPDGGTSRTTWYTAAVYSQTPVWEGTAQPLIPMVGPPRDLRVNGAPATGGSPTVSGVGTSPLLSWAPPALGSPTRYQARLYEIFATSAGNTSRTLLGYYTTTDTQLRLPNLVAGKTYFVLLYAYYTPGSSLDTPFMTRPDYNFASVFSAQFAP
ncbi:fibronectin type III domain-containing protein [Archangium lansingense]|uniref:Fibronectin type-III domain-containing protein n=1 Tax=Archangium lansingense TaxID=2995310 RepID=A0ABT4A3R0_9BACT|nr:hypothetical protein [Archangium lansinium]MCY1076287.1 hypothetical protein [Archangium lansinium]